MDHVSLDILIPNKSIKRHFGVDYFMDLLTGSNEQFKYYSTNLDYHAYYRVGHKKLMPDYYRFLEKELASKQPHKIIGIVRNPDVYDVVDSLEDILNLLDKYECGLFLETSSAKIIDDLDLLKEFSKKHPLMIAVSIATNDIHSKLFGDDLLYKNGNNLLRALSETELNYGVLIKPILPFINDDLVGFKHILSLAITENASFVYPALSIKFDNEKLNAFYDIIDLEFPQNLVKYHELFGYKTTWESPYLADLKKEFVIVCKRHKVLYSMKDIIASYKEEKEEQLTLF